MFNQLILRNHALMMLCAVCICHFIDPRAVIIRLKGARFKKFAVLLIIN